MVTTQKFELCSVKGKALYRHDYKLIDAYIVMQWKTQNSSARFTFENEKKKRKKERKKRKTDWLVMC